MLLESFQYVDKRRILVKINNADFVESANYRMTKRNKNALHRQQGESGREDCAYS